MFYSRELSMGSLGPTPENGAESSRVLALEALGPSRLLG